MTKLSSKLKLTEADMGTAFVRAIENKDYLRYLPQFAGIAPEVTCIQGRPDFVGITTDKDFPSGDRVSVLAEALSTPSLAHVVSLLKRHVSQSEEYLLTASGLSVRVLRRALGTLKECNVIAPTPTGYTLSDHLPDLRTKLWAFELKLDHWQRALFQACQYQAFAHASVVVMSDVGVRRAQKHIERFQQLGIGLVAFDPASLSSQVLVQPTVRHPLSQKHYLYALGSILAQGKCES